MSKLSRSKGRKLDFTRFWNVWERILEENREGTILIVEGKNDMKVLRTLYVNGKIVLSRNHDFWTTISLVQNSKRVLVLTDFDEEGEKEARKLSNMLRNMGLYVLDNLRRELKAVLGPVQRIEDLSHFIDDLIDNAPFKFVKEGLVSKGIIHH